MKNMKKDDTNYQIEAEKGLKQDIKLVSRDQQLDFGDNGDQDDEKSEATGLAMHSDRDNETPVLKEEPLVPKISDKTVNIFGGTKAKQEGMIGRASLKGFLKEEPDEKSKINSKKEETKATEKKDKEDKEPVMGLDSNTG